MTEVVNSYGHLIVDEEKDNFYELLDAEILPSAGKLYNDTIKNLGRTNGGYSVLSFSLNNIGLVGEAGFSGRYVNVSMFFSPNIEKVKNLVSVKIYFYTTPGGSCLGGKCDITNNTTGEDKKFNASFEGSSGGGDGSINFNIKYPALGIGYVLNFIATKNDEGIYSDLYVKFSIFMYTQRPVG